MRNPRTVFENELRQNGRITPTGGYSERTVEWFKKNVLPDFLSVNGLRKETLLDVGCAFGYYTREYALNFQSVVGIDFMADRIEQAVKHNQLGNIKYYCKDIVKGPFGDIKERATTVVSTAVIQHIAIGDRRAALANIRSLCQPKATLVFYDGLVERTNKEAFDGFFQYMSKEFLHEEIKDLWRVVEIKPNLFKTGMHGEILNRITMARVD